MTFGNGLPLIAVAFAILWTEVAQADDYRVTGDMSQACQSGKTDLMTLTGPDEISIGQEDGAKGNLTICVPDDSPANVHIRWGDKSTGNLRNGCAEIPASSVMIRAVDTNNNDTATYYTCVQE